VVLNFQYASLVRQVNWSKKMLRTTLPSIFFKFVIRLSGAEYAKIFLTSKFYYLLFPNPIHKEKTRTANRWETANRNPPGAIKHSSQWRAGVRLCCAMLPASANSAKCWARTILLSQTGMVSHFFIPFIFLQGHTYWTLVELLFCTLFCTSKMCLMRRQGNWSNII